MHDRDYPDEPAGSFPSPPISFTDRENREIEIRTYDPAGPDEEALVEMYLEFDPADRAQGIPPTGEDPIRSWLERILEEGLNIVAWHDERAAGHATLVPQNGAYELAIFVLQEYQQAGIGTHLIEGLLGYGQDEGVETVWLTVERWNTPAINLYEKIGFEISDEESFELEMCLRLSPD